MKLKDLASKPKLVKVVLDDKDIVENYGEELEFSLMIDYLSQHTQN